MKNIMAMRDILCDELEQLAGKTSVGWADIERMNKLADLILELDKISMSESDTMNKPIHVTM